MEGTNVRTPAGSCFHPLPTCWPCADTEIAAGTATLSTRRPTLSCWLECLASIPTMCTFHASLCTLHIYRFTVLPSMLWHCWLGVKKSIQPVKIDWWLLVWLSVQREMQIVCILSSWCRCHPKTPSSLGSFKSRLVLTFWYRLTQVVLEKRPLNGCISSSSSSIRFTVEFRGEIDHHLVELWPGIVPHFWLGPVTWLLTSPSV